MNSDKITNIEINENSQSVEDSIDAYNKPELDLGDQIKTQRELQKAKEKAEEANRLKSIIMVNLNHELRTPLNTIIGASEILQQEITRTELLDLTNIINHSATKLLDTVDTILELSQIEANMLKLHLDKIFLPSFVNQTKKKFEHIAEEKNLSISLIISDYKVYALLDVWVFNQMLNYLLDNAVKYTKHGGILIELDSMKEDDKSWAIIRIKDTGIGIPEDKINYIFDEFRQGSEGLSRNYDGIGLGLTLVKKMVLLMKGTINVESTVGAGSVFTLKFPAVDNNF